MPLVVDASVSLAWCFNDEHSDYATRVLLRLKGDVAIVPGVWLFEVANGLLVAERRSRLTRADVEQVHTILADLPIVVEEPQLAETLGTTIALGRQYQLSAYDAAYLDIALRHGLPLATQDQKLAAAAHRAGLLTLD